MAQSLGYNVAPVGVPTAAAYGDLPSAAPPYGLSSPNPMPPAMASMNPPPGGDVGVQRALKVY